MERSWLLGMRAPSLPLVTRKRWTEVFALRAICLYRSEVGSLDGRETSSGSFLTGLPILSSAL